MKSKNKRKDFYKMNSRKHNRWYSILLSLFLLFSLTGCNENLQTETNQTTDEAVVVSQEAEDTDEPEVEENTEEPDQSEIESQDEDIASQDDQIQESSENNTEAQASSVITTRENIPDYEGYAYIAINDNQPYFSDEDRQRTDAFEEYSELDTLGRCGVAYANICKELQPTEPRGKIGMVKPSGWHTVKYNDIIDGNYLYNRCHLIALIIDCLFKDLRLKTRTAISYRISGVGLSFSRWVAAYSLHLFMIFIRSLFDRLESCLSFVHWIPNALRNRGSRYVVSFPRVESYS